MIERYTSPEMAALWNDENRFNKYLEVEILAAEAWADLGFIPKEAAKKIAAGARFELKRIAELESETKHDLVAFTRAVAENLGEERRYFHFGLTSSDIVDTALSVILGEASAMIRSGLTELEKTLSEKAILYKTTLTIGRTHGIHAEPTSMGLKFALWLAETRRNLERFRKAATAVRVGKLSGAVGNYAHLDPFVEEYVCKKLGLEIDPVSTQIIQRDRHAEFVSVLAIIGSSLEKIALEIRHLQRTEVGEAEEPFYSGQKGSSAMPHKRNPVSAEQICGLARLLRGYAVTAMENVALWHERDISHSSVERVILPDSTIIIDHLLKQTVRIIHGLVLFPEKMRANIDLSGGTIYSQRIMLELVKKGFTREAAYDLIQGLAMESLHGDESFEELVLRDTKIFEVLERDRLKACFDPHNYLKNIDLIYKRLNLE